MCHAFTRMAGKLVIVRIEDDLLHEICGALRFGLTSGISTCAAHVFANSSIIKFDKMLNALLRCYIKSFLSEEFTKMSAPFIYQCIDSIVSSSAVCNRTEVLNEIQVYHMPKLHRARA